MTFILRPLRGALWRVAELLRLKVQYPVYGRHPLIIRGGNAQRRHQIPKSVYFNTMSGKIVIGENTVFGENVMVLTGMHEWKTHRVPESGRDIDVGKNCFIGSGAILIGPLTIGDGAMVGAGAVVTRDVHSDTFVAGNPAKVIRKFP